MLPKSRLKEASQGRSGVGAPEPFGDGVLEVGEIPK